MATVYVFIGFLLIYQWSSVFVWLLIPSTVPDMASLSTVLLQFDVFVTRLPGWFAIEASRKLMPQEDYPDGLAGTRDGEHVARLWLCAFAANYESRGSDLSKLLTMFKRKHIEAIVYAHKWAHEYSAGEAIATLAMQLMSDLRMLETSDAPLHVQPHLFTESGGGIVLAQVWRQRDSGAELPILVAQMDVGTAECVLLLNVHRLVDAELFTNALWTDGYIMNNKPEIKIVDFQLDYADVLRRHPLSICKPGCDVDFDTGAYNR